MSAAVLDASALLALFNGEQGAEVVSAITADASMTCAIHGVNFCEVYYDFLREADEDAAEEMLAEVKILGVEIASEFDEEFLKAVARRKAPGGISLADCFGIALAERRSGHFYTADRHELESVATAGAPIVFIREL